MIFPNFLRSLSLNSFGNSWGNLYISCLYKIIGSFHLWWKKIGKTWKSLKILWKWLQFSSPLSNFVRELDECTTNSFQLFFDSKRFFSQFSSIISNSDTGEASKFKMKVTALIDGNQIQLNSAVQKTTKHKKKTKRKE